MRDFCFLICMIPHFLKYLHGAFITFIKRRKGFKKEKGMNNHLPTDHIIMIYNNNNRHLLNSYCIPGTAPGA